MLELDIRPADGERFALSVDDNVVIGRSASADVAISDRFLSRHHARLCRRGDDWFVEDLGSRNGTLVNGTRISAPTAVKPGDVIGVSASVIVVGGPSPSGTATTTTDGAHSIYRSAETILEDSRSAISQTEKAGVEELRRAADQLRVMVDVHRALADSLTETDLFDRVLDRIFVHFRPQHAAVFLAREDGLDRVANRSMASYTDDFPESRSLAAEVKSYCAECGERLKIASWAVEELL